ncbi:GNAT family N-acetyltransferase [Rhodospirillaceae bacterium KN72]|uniref:GNAT family N-acetyltransferase n=1 Tax=Pacificispira spongiicola TaxID=2729598 RepID=A0A7Y0DWI6_9PROT|nr:GNAT family N-acetyltransferase [Pacificispira spongiicola]NMM42911.1 GNAT family N-acetyltransferase [Pacificispira spongiicola]
MTAPILRELSATDLDAALPGLRDLLHACVAAGASISFIKPFRPEDASMFWKDSVFPGVQAGTCLLFDAEIDGRVVGSVQFDMNTPPNQHHRGEVRKLLVHPDCRRNGIAKLLMNRLEVAALANHRTLITLDTRTGDAAEPLYASLDYERAGTIPGFARDVASDRLDATTIFYKHLTRE